MVSYQDVVKKGVIGVLFLALFILAYYIVKPIIVPIIFALLLAYIFIPTYKRINSRIKHKNISALVLILLIFIVILVPLIYLLPNLLKEVTETYTLLRNFNFESILDGFLGEELASSFSQQFDNIISRLFASLASQLTGILTSIPSLLLKLVVFLFTFFFAVRDYQEMKTYIRKISPFSKGLEEKFEKEFRGITNAIMFGQLLIGLITALAFGVGAYILGVPKVLILTFLTGIVSVIPILGAWIVWFPAGIIMIALGRTLAGGILIIYGALFVSTIDNILRPYFISKNSQLPIVISVIGTIGGLYFIGILGLILGPLILAYVLIIIDFYQQGKLKELFEKE
ncbi:MAG: AI-2E family transporter [Candidatus Pacearchaeota archaeon]